MLGSLIVRNLRLYFRDKASVFFSMLGVILIILMYVLFLGAMVENYAGESAGEDARFVTDSWVMAGVIASATMTTALAGFGVMVDDKSKKISRDFQVAPIQRWKLVMAYVIASMTIAVIMSSFTFLLAELYIISFGGEFLSFEKTIQVFLLILLSVASSSAFVFFLTSSLKSPNAFGTLSSLIGTLIGFLTGVYVPIGQLPAAIQYVIKVFPLSHSAAMLRQVMIDAAVPLEYLPMQMKETLGIVFKYGSFEMPFYGHALVLFATFVLFFGLSIFIVTKHKDKH